MPNIINSQSACCYCLWNCSFQRLRKFPLDIVDWRHTRLKI